MLSLHNFLALVFQALPQPRLADMKKTASRQQAMREEIRQLKLRLADSGLATAANPKAGIEVPLGREVMDDFYLIAQETAVVDNQVKTLKSFLRTITGGGRSPSASSSSSSLSKSRSSSRSRHITPSVTSSSSSTTSTNTSKGTTQQATGTSSNNNPASTSNAISNTSTSSASSAISKQPLKRVTQSVNPLAGLKSAAGGEGAEKELEPNDEQNNDPGTEVAKKKSQYLVLGQDEYKEHRAPVTLISLSSVGGSIASCDSSGVIKV